MDKPTEAQIKEFWEWWGFKFLKTGQGHTPEFTEYFAWRYPSGDKNLYSAKTLPSIDLNNLFKYAVPKLQAEGKPVELLAYEYEGYRVEIFDIVCTSDWDAPIVTVKDKDPALALFWAIWQTLKKGSDA